MKTKKQNLIKSKKAMLGIKTKYLKKSKKTKKVLSIIKTESEKSEKSKKSKKTIKSNSNITIKKLIENKKLKDPNNLRVGYISRNIYGNRYIVKYDTIKKNKFFTKANKEEIACNTLLKENMNKFIGIYKKTKGKNFLKSFSDAKKMAIKQTMKKYPNCLLINIKYSKNRETESNYNMVIRNIKYYIKYGYYKFLRLFS